MSIALSFKQKMIVINTNSKIYDFILMNGQLEF